MPDSLAGRLLEWDFFPFHERWFFHPPQFARLLEDRWNGICQEAAASRRLADLHAAREDLLAVFDQLIAIHKSSLGLFDLQERLSNRSGHPRWERKELARATEELVKMRDDIFSNWHTADDLANILIKKFSLPAERLKELAGKHKPPASWAEETADPFAD